MQNEVGAEVKTLLSLKGEFKNLAGFEWKPGCSLVLAGNNEPKGTMSGEELKTKIEAQGNIVRELKSSGSDKVSYFFISLYSFSQLLLMWVVHYSGDYQKYHHYTCGTEKGFFQKFQSNFWKILKKCFLGVDTSCVS